MDSLCLLSLVKPARTHITKYVKSCKVNILYSYYCTPTNIKMRFLSLNCGLLTVQQEMSRRSQLLRRSFKRKWWPSFKFDIFARQYLSKILCSVDFVSLANEWKWWEQCYTSVLRFCLTAADKTLKDLFLSVTASSCHQLIMEVLNCCSWV